ncbi:hypothetical protein M422DRAFT_54467, partial [Sphaerobolus stellatus SS14]
ADDVFEATKARSLAGTVPDLTTNPTSDLGGSTTTSASQSRTTSETSSLTTSTTSSPGPTPGNSESSSKTKSNAGAIAGGVVGGIGGLLLLGVAGSFLYRRQRNRKVSSQPIIEPFNPLPRMPMTQSHNGTSPYNIPVSTGSSHNMKLYVRNLFQKYILELIEIFCCTQDPSDPSTFPSTPFLPASHINPSPTDTSMESMPYSGVQAPLMGGYKGRPEVY